jgi:hypothetical protein
MPYIGNSPQQSVRQRYYYTATAGQTIFTGADVYGLILKYTDSEYVDVFLNGVLLQKTEDYTATTRTSVTLTSSAQAGDLIEIISYGVFSVSDTVSASRGGTFSNSVNVNSDLAVTGNLTVASTNVLSTIQSSFAKANAALANATGTFSGTLTTTGSIIDSKGDVRDIPINNQIVPYAITGSDTGKTISTNTTIFVPNAVFNSGNTVTVFNNSAIAITITQNSSVTMYLSGTGNTGNRTLSQRGLATILCYAANTFVITGTGLT